MDNKCRGGKWGSGIFIRRSLNVHSMVIVLLWIKPGTSPSSGHSVQSFNQGNLYCHSGLFPKRVPVRSAISNSAWAWVKISVIWSPPKYGGMVCCLSTAKGTRARSFSPSSCLMAGSQGSTVSMRGRLLYATAISLRFFLQTVTWTSAGGYVIHYYYYTTTERPLLWMRLCQRWLNNYDFTNSFPLLNKWAIPPD